MLSDLWTYMKEDNLVEAVLPETVRTRDSWIRHIDSNKLLFAITDGSEVLGAFWVHHIVPDMRCEISIFFRRRICTSDITHSIGEKIIKYVSEELNFPLLISTISTNNKASIKYCLSLGYTKSTEIPNYMGEGKDVILFFKNMKEKNDG